MEQYRRLSLTASMEQTESHSKYGAIWETESHSKYESDLLPFRSICGDVGYSSRYREPSLGQLDKVLLDVASHLELLSDQQ